MIAKKPKDVAGRLNIWAAPSPFGAQRVHLTAPDGLSVSDMLTCVGIERTDRVGVRVSINGETVLRRNWKSVYPKPGDLINIRAVPRGGGGGGGKNPLRTILTIAVFAAAAWAAAAWAPALATTLAGGMGPYTGMQFAIAGGIIKAGVGAVGSLLINAIAPPAKPKLNDFSPASSNQRDQSQTLFIQGARNQIVPFGVVPVVLGTHRMFPFQAAKPFTETVGDLQYARQLFTWGFGTQLTLAEEKIGDTLLTAFEGVETTHVLDGASSEIIPLFDTIPDQTDLTVLLSFEAGYQLRTTGTGIDEISVDVSFPRGLAQFDTAGNRIETAVSYTIEYSPAGEDDWTAQTFTLTLAQTSAVRRNHRFVVTNGTYDVRLKRNTADSTSDQVFDELYWSALRTFTYSAPVALDGLGLTAMRIKASEQLNGVVDQYNAVVSNEIPDWDSETETWITRATSNPASIYRYVLQAPFNEEPLADARIDLQKLQDWHEYCDERGLEFNAVVDYQTTIDDILDDVCAAGRASKAKPDGIHSVVIDRATDDIVQHFSPRKTWGYQLERAFPEVPHAFLVQFTNKEKGYIQDERAVFADGYSEVNATKYQRLELAGVCSAEEAYIHGREHLATMILRPEIHTFYCDVENLVATRGDRIKFSHDAILVGLGWGRVRSVTTAIGQLTTDDGDPLETDDGQILETDEVSVVTHVTLDEPVTMESGKSYCLRFWLADGRDLYKEIATVAGDQRVVEFVVPEPIPTAPTGEKGEHFMFGEVGAESMDLVIQAIMPGPDLTAQLRCVDYAPGIFTAATGSIPAWNSNITIPVQLKRPDAPLIEQIQTGEEVAVLNQDGSISTRMIITLKNNNAGRVEPRVKVRLSGTDLFEDAHVVSASAERVILEDLADGKRYDLEIRYVRTGGEGTGVFSNLYSVPAIRSNVKFEGLSSPPSDPTNFRLQPVGSLAIFSWDQPANIDYDYSEIRFTPELTGATWASAQTLLDDIRTNTRQTALQIGTYLLKHFDRLGNESENAALVVTQQGEIGSFNAIETLTESPTFDGTKDNVVVDASRLILDDPSLLTGIYYFDNSLDMGGVYTARVTPRIVATGDNLSNVLSSWTSLAAVTDLSGSAPSSWSVQLQFRTTEDDPSGTPTWTEWADFVVADYTFRAIEFRLILNTESASNTPSVSELEVVIDMEDRVVRREDEVIPSGGKTFTISPAFKALQDVQVTGQDMVQGDYWKVTDKSATGCKVEFFDKDDISVERTADVQFGGYGKVQT